MYSGTIYYNGNPITVEQAVAQNLITQDSDGNIWLAQDTNHAITIQGDLKLTG